MNNEASATNLEQESTIPFRSTEERVGAFVIGASLSASGGIPAMIGFNKLIEAVSDYEAMPFGVQIGAVAGMAICVGLQSLRQGPRHLDSEN